MTTKEKPTPKESATPKTIEGFRRNHTRGCGLSKGPGVGGAFPAA